MNHTYLIIYPTFAIIDHDKEIVDKVIALYQNNPDVVVVFENQMLYDFEYFGYNIKDSYSKIKNAVAAYGVKSAELTKRNLDAFVYQEVKSEQIFLFIPNVQHLRTFHVKLKLNEKKNIRGIYLLDYERDRIVEIDIYTTLLPTNESISTFATLPTDPNQEISNIQKMFRINLNNHDTNDSHTTSTIYIPKDPTAKSHLYKILRGEYPDLWIKKCNILKRIGLFLNTHAIPNALPTQVFFKDSYLILEQPYIDGTTLHRMISRRGIKEFFKSDTRKTLVNYLLDISHAEYFYHFLGIYISDIKEDNFFYYTEEGTNTKKNGIVPIDIDGASLYLFASSQPIVKYRDSSSVSNSTFYYQTSITETYSFSYLVYRILFNNNSPINEDKGRYLKDWYKKDFTARLERWEKEQLQLWKALPKYIQDIFRMLFCNDDSCIIEYNSDEWNEILDLYRNDLKSSNAINNYENNEQNELIGSPYSFSNQLILRYFPIIESSHNQNRIENSSDQNAFTKTIKRVLIGANIASFGAILFYIIRILSA